MESLVTQLHARATRPAPFPPVCAATAPAAEAPAAPRAVVRINQLTEAEGPHPLTSGRTGAGSITFQSGVTYVSLPVVVTDAKGRAIEGLTAADFRVYEDGVEQRINQVSALTAPYTLALLIDASSSMRAEWRQVLMPVLQFFETLRPDDRVLLVSFADRVSVLSEFTAERGLLRAAVNPLTRGQGTRLYDAIALTVRRRLAAVAGRAAILLLTDGLDTRSRLADAEGTEALVGEAHVPVYAIQFDTRRSDYALPYGLRINDRTIREMTPVIVPEGAGDNAPLFARADAYLTTITSISGGRLYRTENLRDLGEAFRRVSKDLGEQYTLGYYPVRQGRDGTYRATRVEVLRPDVLVHTRPGYRAGAAQREGAPSR